MFTHNFRLSCLYPIFKIMPTNLVLQPASPHFIPSRSLVFYRYKELRSNYATGFGINLTENLPRTDKIP
ncbi:MAG: hypothetical protein DU429_05720 [Candidatus Tokpelaia sp.]|nr:MAG: hypothetical protein DU430_07530 [Candidatus Tokpelaia sp.]KAA6206721.1 MAG: hypothetical protein DU429_05720 [Candidatus Tokpelaia sp.]